MAVLIPYLFRTRFPHPDTGSDGTDADVLFA